MGWQAVKPPFLLSQKITSRNEEVVSEVQVQPSQCVFLPPEKKLSQLVFLQHRTVDGFLCFIAVLWWLLFLLPSSSSHTSSSGAVGSFFSPCPTLAWIYIGLGFPLSCPAIGRPLLSVHCHSSGFHSHPPESRPRNRHARRTAQSRGMRFAGELSWQQQKLSSRIRNHWWAQRNRRKASEGYLKW